MNDNMIQNPKMETPQTPAMNDCDYLFDVLANEKQLSGILSTAASEMSNEDLYNEVLKMFSEIKDLARETFNLAFKLGWYPLEKAEVVKIEQKHNELTTKLTELETN